MLLGAFQSMLSSVPGRRTMSVSLGLRPEDSGLVQVTSAPPAEVKDSRFAKASSTSVARDGFLMTRAWFSRTPLKLSWKVIVTLLAGMLRAEKKRPVYAVESKLTRVSRSELSWGILVARCVATRWATRLKCILTRKPTILSVWLSTCSPALVWMSVPDTIVPLEFDRHKTGAVSSKISGLGLAWQGRTVSLGCAAHRCCMLPRFLSPNGRRGPQARRSSNAL